MMISIKDSIKTGISFGLTSGTITTLGLITGLNAATSSREAVIGGIITIAVADAFSDSLGIHIAEESKSKTRKYIWESTLTTFLTKLIFTLTFLVPFLFLGLGLAIWSAIGWGVVVICVLSYFIAKSEKEKPHVVILEHVSIMALVILITNALGGMIVKIFGA
jgi:vacuolar iron transporter family protein